MARRFFDRAGPGVGIGRRPAHVIDHQAQRRIAAGNARHRPWVRKIQTQVATLQFGQSTGQFGIRRSESNRRRNTTEFPVALVLIKDLAKARMRNVRPRDYGSNEFVPGCELEMEVHIMRMADGYGALESVALQNRRQKIRIILGSKVLVGVYAHVVL